MKVLKSPRWRRRLIKIAVVLAIVPLAYLGIHYSTGGHRENANGPVIPNPVQPKSSPFTPAEKQAVRPVLASFIRHAVARQDPGKAWDLAGPDLREGSSQKQWDKGKMPVVPYPAADRGLGDWSYVKYSYTNSVGLEVFLFPKPGSGESAITADAEVVKDKQGKWYVNYWMEERSHGPPALSAAQKKAEKKAAAGSAKGAKTHRTAAQQEEPVVQATRTKGLWLAVPLGLLSLIILGPLTAMIVIWLRNRREQRRMMRSA